MKGKNVNFIVGAGAVENAWAPVIKAIKETLRIETNGDGANFLFARYIYLLKFYAKLSSKGDYADYLDGMKSNISILKQNIANELIKAQNTGEIKAQKNFKEIVNKFVSSNLDKALLVSTNWDEIIDIEINKLFCSNHPKPNSKIESFHIHGSVKTPEEIYLPSEITQENFRTEDEENKMGSNHANLMSFLEKGNRTILYGISLDPLDAELIQTLAAGWSTSNIEEIIIVNPSHEKVAKRVKLMINERYPAKIYGYDPNNLDLKIEY